ncbi:adaptor protein MecA [Bacillus cytotoxicus]|uniref:Adapter protein MecA n=2 Tax=Bacillus cytotoxicus TaxID=580165 RepID=A0AAX2CEC4_9BACI|nr:MULTISPECIES: adaptor protein MecA [Bacillus cereus group]ABS21240.1 Negative regulator of genetic competence [Bacillus cytotoxicus NVH 391-98]AWC27886.1 adaptor protein MecA [Bacillus cytotoxicus]AWC31933.1 adaptor protein MecA [Bacillus cytotoxicus]AWC35967.1 adaptor protein MecA [Bacillus cytotoxicus]AWC40733.1 adaptor protein MecA [Bacillus cytotoxicus]
MDIERINDHTMKFFITYVDIEDRGFNREEIWYNRERSEQLFWEMMDEARDYDDFFIDGPLWIQVQALDKGIEVLVTKAQLSKDGQKLELPIGLDKIIDIPLDESIESLFQQELEEEGTVTNFNEDGTLGFLIKFEDFEDVISLSHRLIFEDIKDQLYSFENRYYVYVEFDEVLHDEEEIDRILSIILEYGEESTLTIHRVSEYGKEIMSEHALETIRKHFPSKT